MRVHHLNCATMCPLASRYVLGVDRMVAHCLLIETERDGLVLVDTGFGTRDIAGQTGLSVAFRRVVGPTLDPREPAAAQVTALGRDPADVRHIVITHLDLDHAGGLPDFPNARVHLHAREHAAAMARGSLKERERYKRAHWHHGPKWEVYTEDGDTWRGLPAVTKLRGLDADIALVPMHGHTRGHSAVVVRAPEVERDGLRPARGKDRWLVHAGDAYFHRAAIAGESQPIGFMAFERATQMDSAKRRASLAALQQLHASYDDLDVFCAHDETEYTALATSRRA